MEQQLKDMANNCVACDICVQECAFLGKHGNPRQIAQSYDASLPHHQIMPFECSLCGLCTAVCPVNLDPVSLFIEMRKRTIKDVEKKGCHKRILAYEKRGTSKRYTYYGLPENCDTVFFPGCALSGTRPKTTLRLVRLLQKTLPSLGIVLDCCTEPSLDLGYSAYFEQMFSELNGYLLNAGVSHILVACPNCYRIFRKYGQNLSVQTLYEYLDQNRLLSFPSKIIGRINLHDPCPVRFEDGILASVRNILTDMGFTLAELPHSKSTTLCCGEGGAVNLVSDALASTWRETRIRELDDNSLITYCAGCAGFLSKSTPTHHLLDLILEPEKTLNGQAKASIAPFTYFNRLLLKQKIKKIIPAHISRERTFTGIRE